MTNGVFENQERFVTVFLADALSQGIRLLYSVYDLGGLVSRLIVTELVTKF